MAMQLSDQLNAILHLEATIEKIRPMDTEIANHNDNLTKQHLQQESVNQTIQTANHDKKALQQHISNLQQEQQLLAKYFTEHAADADLDKYLGQWRVEAQQIIAVTDECAAKNNKLEQKQAEHQQYLIQHPSLEQTYHAAVTESATAQAVQEQANMTFSELVKTTSRASVLQQKSAMEHCLLNRGLLTQLSESYQDELKAIEGHKNKN